MSKPDHAPIVESYENYIKNLGAEKYEELYNQYERDFRLYGDSIKAGFKNAVHPVEPMGDKHYKRPYVLYDFMQKRIIPYSAKGVIWYQGEANALRAEQYQTLFPALIQEYREDFKNPKLPFLFVQLANYDHPSYGTRPIWAELREAQLMTWQKVKNTAMVVTMDVGEKNTIHPTNKKPVGERLATCAFNKVYGMKNAYSGPVYKTLKFNEDKAIISFDFIYGGLSTDNELKGFTICGKDKKFVSAKAKIENNKVIVSSEQVKEPVAVRYSWINWSNGNLRNNEGFPASPFRTDNFDLLTKGIKAPRY
jgi:sialate O-acetylesterase